MYHTIRRGEYFDIQRPCRVYVERTSKEGVRLKIEELPEYDPADGEAPAILKLISNNDKAIDGRRLA